MQSELQHQDCVEKRDMSAVLGFMGLFYTVSLEKKVVLKEFTLVTDKEWEWKR